MIAVRTFIVSSDQDYPIGLKHPEWVKTETGRSLSDITLEAVMNGEIKHEDLCITAETLELQAQIADNVGRKTLAQNFRRAAELTRIPDEVVLHTYEKLRPRRCTKAELLQIAKELESKYGAVLTSRLIREAAEVYEARGILREE